VRTNTKIVYSCNLNFHTVVHYLELLTRNGLAERVEGEHIRRRTTARGAEALGHMRALEELMPKMRIVEEIAAESRPA
jgi:predicted transcriptional regulator